MFRFNELDGESKIYILEHLWAFKKLHDRGLDLNRVNYSLEEPAVIDAIMLMFENNIDIEETHSEVPQDIEDYLSDYGDNVENDDFTMELLEAAQYHEDRPHYNLRIWLPELKNAGLTKEDLDYLFEPISQIVTERESVENAFMPWECLPPFDLLFDAEWIIIDNTPKGIYFKFVDHNPNYLTAPPDSPLHDGLYLKYLIDFFDRLKTLTKEG